MCFFRFSFRCTQDITEVGFKYHMNDIAAAIGLANLQLAKDNVARQRANALYYDESSDPESACWLHTLLVPERDSFIRGLAARGIEASPVHSRNDTQPAFRFPSGELPGVDYFAAHEVAVPVGWWLTNEERERVSGEVRGVREVEEILGHA